MPNTDSLNTVFAVGAAVVILALVLAFVLVARRAARITGSESNTMMLPTEEELKQMREMALSRRTAPSTEVAASLSPPTATLTPLNPLGAPADPFTDEDTGEAATKLRKLNELHKRKLISDQELSVARAQLLADL